MVCCGTCGVAGACCAVELDCVGQGAAGQQGYAYWKPAWGFWSVYMQVQGHVHDGCIAYAQAGVAA